MLMNEKEEELNSIIMELRKNYTSLQEKFAKEESNKLILSVNDMYKRLQEYNTSLQQYNSKLQSELHQTNDILKNAEKVKVAVLENISNLRGQCTSLQEQLQKWASNTELKNLREAAASEVGSLRLDLQQVREDRDRQLTRRFVGRSVEVQGVDWKVISYSGVRTLLFDDGADNETNSVSFPTATENLGRGIELLQHGQKYSFTFDKVFVPESSQEEVFEEVSQLVPSALDGYMVSMLEIYNETIRDLLSTTRPLTESSAVVKSVCKTQMNEQSSRSHFVFTLRIYGYNESTEQQVQGVLNLIELAGSEHLSKSGSTGDRLKETQAINKSLSSLSDVIFSLARKEDHVPFRNSKLAYLLQQPCLGGDSKTLIVVNVSPAPSSINESLCSLRFASRVNACKINN
ncbi:kinesin-like protein KIN-14N [Tanacetum coccineum]